MPTEKQIQANRLNALKSTGPKSPAGKARSASNALKHGLLTRDVLMPGEKAKELMAFREEMMAELAPQGELEEFLADRVVESAWRLRRAGRMERQIVQDKLSSELRSRAKNPGYYADQPVPTADSVAAGALSNKDTYDKLVRYEAHIQRGLYKALHELQRLQAARLGGPVLPPVAIDVEVSGLSTGERESVGELEGDSVVCEGVEGRRVGESECESVEGGSAAEATNQKGGG